MTDQTDHERVRFALSGRSERLDPRVNAYRADLADMALAGRIFAHYYAFPARRACIAAHAPLHAEPDRNATMTSELLFGETFAVIDRSTAWAWGYCEHDHYVGYLPAEALGEASQPGTAMLSDDVDVHEAPDSGSAVIASLPMGARIDATAQDGWIETPLGFVAEASVITAPQTDPVAVAERLIDAPYVWGGRTRSGIDCSGLVQIAFGQCGIDLPRDSDLQMAASGADLPDDADLQRADIVFFPNHVGLMTDRETLLHATHHHGKVVTEPLAHVVARIAAEHEVPILTRKRIDPSTAPGAAR